MQPTLPTWAWESWERRARGRGTNRSAPAQPRSRPRPRDLKYAVYNLREDTRHLTRLLLNRPRDSALPAAVWHFERFDNPPPWTHENLQEAMQKIGSFELVSDLPELDLAAAAAGAGRVGRGHPGVLGGVPVVLQGGEGRGWAAAAVLVAILFLIVRSTESCIVAMFKTRFCRFFPSACFIRSEADPGSLPPYPFDVPHMSSVMSSSEQPPPYAECAVAADLPPPYDTCPQPYAHHHTTPPQHIHTGQRQNILNEYAELSTDFDNVQNDLIESRIATSTASIPPDDTDNLDTGPRTELVFSEGRVLERVATDIDPNSNATGGNDEEDQSKEIIMYIDETAANNATANRVILI